MDLSVSATSSAYTAATAYGQAGSASAPRANAQATTPPSGQDTSSTTASNAQASPDKQLQDARKKNPAAEVTSHPGYAFEVDQQNHKIMKVSDNKGVLIYQVPSKGELALIEAEDSSKKRIQLTA